MYSWTFFYIFLSKTAVYLYLGLNTQATEEAFSPKKRTSNTLKFLNFFYFCGSFLPFLIRIRIHWPYWIRIQSGSGTLGARSNSLSWSRFMLPIHYFEIVKNHITELPVSLSAYFFSDRWSFPWLIQACRERNVDCIVAPYEADSQLAFLNRWASDKIYNYFLNLCR